MFLKTSQKLPKGIFKACIVPRPIAWVSSIDKDGNHNLSPFSYFNIVCENPAMVMFSTTGPHSEGGEKDTVRNIEQTKEFTVNLVNYENKDAMNMTSLDFPRNVNEFDVAGIESVSGELVRSCRVKSSPISLECIYHQSIQLPVPRETSLINRIIIGEVVGLHIHQGILDEDGRIDIKRLDLIARLGYDQYTRVTTPFELHRAARTQEQVCGLIS